MSSPITIHNATPRTPAPEYQFRLPELLQIHKSPAAPQFLYLRTRQIATRYGIPVGRLMDICRFDGSTRPDAAHLDRMIRIALDTPGATEARDARDAAQRAQIALEGDADSRTWIAACDAKFAAQAALEALIADALTAAGY